MLLLTLVSCLAPESADFAPQPGLAPVASPSSPAPVPTTPTTPTTPPPSPVNPFDPFVLSADVPSLHLSVPRLLPGERVTLRAESAPAGATVGFWQGALGGSTCPADLSFCLEVDAALLLAEVVADGAGVAELDWDVPAVVGSYPVFQTTVGEPPAHSQVVMRGIGEVDPWVPDGIGVISEPVLPPGDYYELSSAMYGALFPMRGGTQVEASVQVVPGSYFGADMDWMYGARDPLAVIPDIEGEPWVAEIRDTSYVEISVFEEYYGRLPTFSLHVSASLPAIEHDWTFDADLDRYGDGPPVTAWLAPDGYAWRDGDCDDADRAMNPDERDICGDGIDQDCSGADRACP